MAVSVVGFDVGCFSSYIAVARGGGIETITNEYSDRLTPTCVAFSEKNRLMGTSAKLQHVTNIRNTFVNFVPLIGKKFNDFAITKEQRYLPFKIEPGPDGRVLVRVNRAEGPLFFTPEQLVAMQLTKLKQLTEKELNSKVLDVVINVPAYYTDAERRAMIDASQIAGLNCVKLVNDTTAIGTAYGLYNTDLPSVDKPPRNVVFINIGYVSTQVALCAFNSGKMKVICTVCDWQLGGRDFDNVIFQKLAEEFQTKFGKGVADHPKAAVRLLQECEKVKKAMSANSQELPVNVECLLDEKDLTSRVKRADFEEWSSEILARFTKLLEHSLAVSKLDVKDIHSVELVGGTSRIPALKSVVASVFKQEGRTTLNADEAVARGCALQAALCSPVFKVREFTVTEACPHAITLQWDRDDSVDQSMLVAGENEGEVTVNNEETSLEVFPLFHGIPSSRRLFFNRRGPFVLIARYSNPQLLPNQNVVLGSFKVSIPHQKPNEVSKIRVKVRVNNHGIFSVAQAEMAEEYEKEVEVDVPMETQPASENAKATEDKPMEVEVTPSNGDVCMAASPDSTANNKNTADGFTPTKPSPVPKKTIVKKKAIRYKDLPIEASVNQFSINQINEFCETEGKLFEQDELEFHRANAKNAVEEYVYEMRNKLQDMLNEFATSQEQNELLEALQHAEDWLYGDGEDMHRQAYVDRLKQIKSLGDPIEMRATEKQDRASALHSFERSIVHIRKIVDSAAAGQEAYNHLTSEQINQLQTTLSQYEGWLRERMHAQNSRPLTEDPIIKAVDIMSQQRAMEAICHPIVNTPKPAPPPPPPAPEPVVTNDSNAHENNAPKTHKVNTKNASKPTKTQQNCNNSEMDVD